MEGHSASEGMEPRNAFVVAGRTLTVEVGNSPRAVILVRHEGRTGVRDHGRPSQGIVRNLGDPASKFGDIIPIICSDKQIYDIVSPNSDESPNPAEPG